MKSMPFVVLGLIALMPLACEKGKFNEETSSSSVYSVRVVDADAKTGDTKSDDEAVENSSGKDKDEDKDEDSGACAAAGGVSQDRVHISGSQKEMTLSSDQAFSLKVTGNQNAVTIKVGAAASATKLPALCLFVSGNQNHVILDIASPVGQIFVKARGHSALIEGLVGKDGVVEGIKVDAKGHEPRILLKGEGKYPTL